MAERTDTKTLADALDVLAREIQSGDGVANAAIAEAAERLRELEARLESGMQFHSAEFNDRLAAEDRVEELEKALKQAIAIVYVAMEAKDEFNESVHEWHHEELAAYLRGKEGPDA